VPSGGPSDARPSQAAHPSHPKRPALERLVNSGGAKRQGKERKPPTPERTSDQAVEALRRLKEEALENANATDPERSPVEAILDELAE